MRSGPAVSSVEAGLREGAQSSFEADILPHKGAGASWGQPGSAAQGGVPAGPAMALRTPSPRLILKLQLESKLLDKPFRFCVLVAFHLSLVGREKSLTPNQSNGYHGG
ncbi:unnamed protein product [Caretta caretta]